MEQNTVAACPKCGKQDAKKLTYTWWGGAVGPRLFNHVKCNNCKTEYNGKTGQSNTVPIIIYSVVIMVVCFLAFYALGLAMQ